MVPIVEHRSKDPLGDIQRTGEYSLILACGAHVLSAIRDNKSLEWLVWELRGTDCNGCHNQALVSACSWSFEPNLLVSNRPVSASVGTGKVLPGKAAGPS